MWFLTASVNFQAAVVEISQNVGFADFPDAIDFSLIGSSTQPIERAVLTYGSNGRSCTQSKNEIELDFDPTQALNLTANWDVTQGSIFPRGAHYWWQWTLIDTAGNEIELERQDGVFEDNWFVWESATLENVTVSWYRGDEAYARELLDQAIIARENLAAETGLLLDEPVDFYLFNDPRDLGRSLPGAPGWAGGVAFPEHNIIMVAANENSEEAAEYGRLTTKHEFGHLVIGNLTFNCLTNLPTWLNEGLAQVAEGPAEPRNIARVQAAVADGNITSLASLEGSFSIHGDRAGLGYAQSDQMTRFLLDKWGNAGMLLLLETITAGNTIDDALQTAYGQTQFEIENMWRAEIGAEPLTAVTQPEKSAAPAPTLSLLAIPTDPPPPPTAELAAEPTVATKPPHSTVVPTQSPTGEPLSTETVSPDIDINEVAAISTITAPPADGSNRESANNFRPIIFIATILLLALLGCGVFIYSRRTTS